MPLLVDLSDWRPRLKQTINELVANDDHASDVAFFADFPGNQSNYSVLSRHEISKKYLILLMSTSICMNEFRC